MYVKTQNGQVHTYPYTLSMFRKENPNVSFPSEITESILNGYGVFRVVEQVRPEFNTLVQNCVPDAVPHQGVETWEIGFTVENKPLAEAEANVRLQRDRLLGATDWLIIMHTEKGTNIPAAWEIYRQNLRDITAQAGFPHTVTWPEKPE